ncbi:MAG: methyl-accepting chemotaxis protein [Blautia marasmi]
MPLWRQPEPGERQGFAVVAGEVRNLANKSAEASRNTTVLIESSLRAVENGAVSDEPAKTLKRVVEGVGGVADAIDKISEASRAGPFRRTGITGDRADFRRGSGNPVPRRRVLPPARSFPPRRRS